MARYGPEGISLPGSGVRRPGTPVALPWRRIADEPNRSRAHHPGMSRRIVSEPDGSGKRHERARGALRAGKVPGVPEGGTAR